MSGSVNNFPVDDFYAFNAARFGVMMNSEISRNFSRHGNNGYNSNALNYKMFVSFYIAMSHKTRDSSANSFSCE